MKFRFARLRRLGPARIFAVLLIGSTLLMGVRSCQHRDTVGLVSPKRAYKIHSGSGEFWIEIVGHVGSGWSVGSETMKIRSRGWPKMFRYERRLLSLEAGAAYWVILVVESAAIYLLTNRRKWSWKPKPKSKPKKKRAKSS